jgi:hypothetical protein
MLQRSAQAALELLLLLVAAGAKRPGGLDGAECPAPSVERRQNILLGGA